MDDRGRDRLEIELRQKDLETYRKLETWGASLLLGAIALFGKQLFDWNAEVNTRCKLEQFVFWAPAVIGLVAFVFLRAVNHRIHSTQSALWGFVQDTSGKAWGTLGIILALMPSGLGLFVSWALFKKWGLLWLAGFGLFFVAAIIHVIVQRGWSLNTVLKKIKPNKE